MIYLRNNKVNTCYLGDKKLNKIYLGDKLVWPQKKSFDANGHDYVEIAGIKWATMNVGANDVTDYGLYFQWGDTSGYTANQVTGDTEPKKAFSEEDYNSELLTKYNTEGMTLALDDDAVHANWGGSWRMPTVDDLQKLRGAVDTEWTDNYNNSGVAGMVLTDKNSNETLFLPACGGAYHGAVSYAGVGGGYWSSSLDTDSNAYNLNFLSDSVYDVYSNDRCRGLCVRGVLAEN